MQRPRRPRSGADAIAGGTAARDEAVFFLVLVPSSTVTVIGYA